MDGEIREADRGEKKGSDPKPNGPRVLRKGTGPAA